MNTLCDACSRELAGDRMLVYPAVPATDEYGPLGELGEIHPACFDPADMRLAAVPGSRWRNRISRELVVRVDREDPQQGVIHFTFLEGTDSPPSRMERNLFARYYNEPVT